MLLTMTAGTQRDQIVEFVVSKFAAKLLVVDLQVLRGTTETDSANRLAPALVAEANHTLLGKVSIWVCFGSTSRNFFSKSPLDMEIRLTFIVFQFHRDHDLSS
jgi:hypothetical protein